MAVLNLAAGLALTWLLHSACALPSQLFHACTESAGQRAARLVKALSLQLPQPYETVEPHLDVDFTKLRDGLDSEAA